jgi:hypothetical protein
VKRGRLVSAAPERPLGLECTKPLFITWLAMGAYAVAISTLFLSHAHTRALPSCKNGRRGLRVTAQLKFVIFRSQCERKSVACLDGWAQQLRYGSELCGAHWVKGVSNPIPYPNACRSPPSNGCLAGAAGVPPRGNRICSAGDLDFVPLHTEGIYIWRKKSCFSLSLCVCVCVWIFHLSCGCFWIWELTWNFF